MGIQQWLVCQELSEAARLLGNTGTAGAVFPPGLGWWPTTGGNCWDGTLGGGAVTGHLEEGLVPAVACLQEASFQFWDLHLRSLRATVWLAVLGHGGIRV